VAQLDIRRSQILIEAAIIEVGGTTGRDLGVQWGSGDPDNGLVGINFSGVGRSLNDIAATIANPSASKGLADGITFAAGRRNSDGDIDFGGVLQALASNANVNLLSTPSVLTLDNQEAKIIVGENVPFITGSSTSTGDGVSNPFTTIKREDVGIQLKVTPTLIDDDNVKLVISQEVSSVKPKEDSIQSSDLITSKRSISTTVLAGNRQTVVLGGNSTSVASTGSRSSSGSLPNSSTPTTNQPSTWTPAGKGRLVFEPDTSRSERRFDSKSSIERF